MGIRAGGSIYGRNHAMLNEDAQKIVNKIVRTLYDELPEDMRVVHVMKHFLQDAESEIEELRVIISSQ